MDENKNFTKKFTKKKASFSEHGKVPPQATNLEEAVLGALMLDKDAVALIIDILRPASFYKEAHQHIYKAICILFEKSHPIDLLTVTEELKKLGKLEMVGGPYQLVELTNRVASSANIEFHARIIAQKFIQRELIRSSTETITAAYEDTVDVFDLLDSAEQNLFNITEQNLSRGSLGMSTLVNMAVKQLEEMSGKEEGLTGVPTGFLGLDQLTSGWQPSDLIIIAARPGMGKCLGKGTKVLKYDGNLEKVENIQVGDLLMGDDSTPRKVASIARGQEKMYWIHQNKGISYRVNESHILSLKRSRNEGKHIKGDVLNISVRDWLAKSNKFKSNYKGYKVPVEFKEQSTLLAPYFIGLWLGDDSNTKPEIYTQDPEIVTYIHEFAKQQSLQVRAHLVPDKCPAYAIVGGTRGHGGYSLMDDLRSLDLINNKHIPQEYLINSTSKRLALLAGLLDSDGHYLAQSNGYEITQKNQHLAEQIKFLCDSLGFRTSLKAEKASIASIGFESIVYRVRIYGNVDTIPVKINYKAANPWKSVVDWQVTGITVEEDIVDDYYGFTLDANNLFLLEDMTVTHNTAFTMAVARNAAIEFNKGVAFFSLEMSSLQLVNRLISMETEIPSEKLRKGQLEDYEWQQLHAQVDKLSNVPLFIDDTPGISIFELRAKCRRLKMQHDIQMVVVDYLQLMTGGGDNKGNREQEISMISRGLKGLAKELSVPVIALSQLSRAVETRGGSKRPQLSDLRECITGDTLVYIASSGLYQRVDSLVGKKGFEVLAIDKQQQLQKARCLDVWETGEKEIFELTTQSGYTIKASANHPFYTIDGWKKLETLQEGSYVATPRYLDYNKENKDLLDQEIILLAHMIGDGCFVERQPIHYTSQDPASLDIVEASAQQLWDIKGRRVKDLNSKNCYHLYLPSPYPLTHGVRHPFSLLLEKVGLTFARSHEKTVPEAIFNSSMRQLALFIHHIWATDGGIFIRKGKGSSKIYYSSNSIQLIQQLQSLLLRFEISASISKGQKENYKPNYVLNITGKDNIAKFHQHIGIHGTKIKTLEDLVALNKTKRSIPNSDIVPKNLWQYIKDLKRVKGFTERKFQAALEMSYSGSSLYRSNISRNRLNKIATILESEELLKWANSAIKWEKIVSIKPVGKEMTYDIHVEQYHNFVANNFIIHNSGAIEQDADIVSFIYRPEYYQILEDEEGNSLKGIGEIIVAKHRNGALDSVRLKWDGQFAKFSNLEDDAFTGLDDSSFFDQANNELSGETFSSKINKANEKDNGIDDVPF